MQNCEVIARKNTNPSSLAMSLMKMTGLMEIYQSWYWVKTDHYVG